MAHLRIVQKITKQLEDTTVLRPRKITESWTEGKSVLEKQYMQHREPQPGVGCDSKLIQEFGGYS